MITTSHTLRPNIIFASSGSSLRFARRQHYKTSCDLRGDNTTKNRAICEATTLQNILSLLLVSIDTMTRSTCITTYLSCTLRAIKIGFFIVISECVERHVYFFFFFFLTTLLSLLYQDFPYVGD